MGLGIALIVVGLIILVFSPEVIIFTMTIEGIEPGVIATVVALVGLVFVVVGWLFRQG